VVALHARPAPARALELPFALACWIAKLSCTLRTYVRVPYGTIESTIILCMCVTVLSSTVEYLQHTNFESRACEYDFAQLSFPLCPRRARTRIFSFSLINNDNQL
jgi:hypothetical protein